MKKFSVVQRHKSRGIKTWYGRTYDTDTGAVQYVSLGVEKKKDAMAWRDRMIGEQLSGRTVSVVDISIAGSIEAFLKTVDGSRITYANYKCALRMIEEFMRERGILNMSGITPIAVSEFFSSSAIARNKASTRKKRLTIYKTWAKWVIEMYEPEWKRNPFTSVKINGDRSKPRDFWTIEQVEEIIDAAEDAKTKLVYALMAFAGMRFHEVRKLTLNDLFDVEGNIRKKLKIDGKGGKVAFVPICERLKKQILSTYNPYQNKTKFLEFLSIAKGKKLHILTSNNSKSNGTLQEIFSQNPNLASFGGGVHLHRFRHSFISNLIRAGCNIRCVAELARHENATITLKYYAHLLPSDTEKALEIFSQAKTKEVESENN